MSAFYFDKQPWEEFSITVDFASLRLDSGESISTTVVTAVDCDDDSDVTSEIIGSDSEAAGIVTVGVKGGTDGSRYRITVRVTTDSANKFEADIVMEIKNR